MASLESKIYAELSTSTALTALVGTNIYPNVRFQFSGDPALVYTRIGGQRDYTLTGYSNLENPRVSIEIYATAIDMRREISTVIIPIMEGSTRFKAITEIGPIDIYDPTVDEYKRILDFSIWNHDT